MRMGMFLIGKRCQGCGREKGVVVGAWGCDWVHAYSDRMSASQDSGSLMRGVSSLVSPQPL